MMSSSSRRVGRWAGVCMHNLWCVRRKIEKTHIQHGVIDNQTGKILFRLPCTKYHVWEVRRRYEGVVVCYMNVREGAYTAVLLFVVFFGTIFRVYRIYLVYTMFATIESM